MHKLQTSLLWFPRTPSCEAHCYNILWSDSLPPKPSLTWLGLDPVSYFTYLELKSRNPLGWREVVQLTTIYWFYAADEQWLNYLFI